MNIKNSAFHPSVNIRLDFGKEEFIQRYIPIASHMEAFKGVLAGFNQKGNRSHILVGPYGSGKSLIGTLITGLASKQISSKSLDKFSKKFNLVDEKISNELVSLSQSEVRYLPIILEGNIGNLRTAITSALLKLLKKEGLSTTLPGVISDILQAIDKWQSMYPETYSSFKELLRESNWDYDSWLQEVESFNQNAISVFTSVYPNLTAGSKFVPSYSNDFIGQLEYVLEDLHAKGIGLLILHDEFGRFLQSIGINQVHETMQDLQDLAELAMKSPNQNLSLLLITHRNMRQYASRFGIELEKEFNRIEGRFSTYNIENDPETFIRLANQVTEKIREQHVADISWIVDGLRRFPLFLELSANETENFVVEGSYPLHPVTMFALPRLANLVAQNERTLFTFLESDEIGGLRYHFDKNKDWYTVDQLIDYFEPSLDEQESGTLVKNQYLLYKRLLHRLVPSTTQTEQIKVLKLLTVWHVANLRSKELPTSEFIAFSLRWSLEKTAKILEELQNLKVVRMTYTEDNIGYWILFEGSTINVAEEIENRLSATEISHRKKMQILEGVLPKHYFLPKRYNDHKSITRFAKIYVIHAVELEEMFSKVFLESESDLRLILLVGDTLQQLETLKEKSKIISEKYKDVVLIVSQTPLDELDVKLSQLAIIQQLLKDKVFLIQDAYLEEEILLMEKSLISEIQIRLRYFLDFTDDCLWIHNGKSLRINSEWKLSETLSEILFSIYSFTPEIRNESFNRRSITKVQEKAAIQVARHLMTYLKTNQGFQIQGYGPDYLIYSTIFKKRSIDLQKSEVSPLNLKTLESLSFDELRGNNSELLTHFDPLQPENLKDPNYLALRDDLLKVLRIGEGTLEDLIQVCIKPPFGVRRVIIPILIPALLGKEWRNILFYSNGTIVLMTPERWWEIIHNEDPSTFTFKLQDEEEKYIPLIQIIEEVYADCIEEADREEQVSIYVTKVLYRWLKSLPRLAQSTNKQSKESNRFREIIRLGEFRPTDALQQLDSLLDNGKNKLKLLKLRQESESYLVSHLEHLRNVLSKKLPFSDTEKLFSWVSDFSATQKKKSKLLSAILNSNSETLINAIAETLVGVNRENWSDATDKVFEAELINEITLLSRSGLEKEYMEIEFDEGNLLIPLVNLSNKSSLIFDNIKQTIQHTGRTVPKEELVAILWRLLKETSEDGFLITGGKNIG